MKLGLMGAALAMAAGIAQASPVTLVHFDLVDAPFNGLLPPGINPGHHVWITLTLDNGTTGLASQTWSISHLQSVTFDINHGEFVYTFSRPFGSGFFGSGSFRTDSAGVLTSTLSSWGDSIVGSGYTGTGPWTPSGWELSPSSPIPRPLTFAEIYAGNSLMMNLHFQALMADPAFWTLSAVPAPGGALLFGSGLAAIGCLVRRRRLLLSCTG